MDVNETMRIRKEMGDVNETIHQINQEIFEMKKMEENLMEK